jgi:hypothetical protein
VLKDFIRRRKKGNRTTVQDEYTRYCLLDVTEELQGGYLQWWMIHEAEFPRLAQFARDIFGIPGMSAEVERLFSSAKLMIPPHRSSLKPESIEAGECIRSWVAGGCSLGATLIIYHLTSETGRPRGFRLRPLLGSAIF